jgi:mRNA-degrading endonuclease RelE of RelBE toxin-antitoxin system
MSYRLLISLEAIEYLETLPKSVRQRLRARFVAMLEEPAMFSDFVCRESDNRRLDVHVVGPYAVYFWDDFADRDLKIIRIEKADR